jgi:PAS domain-containing protein
LPVLLADGFYPEVIAMGKEDGFHAAVDLIYGAVLDEPLWPTALIKLADILGTAHIGVCALDSRANAYHSIAPRTDPAWDAKYKQYWAFHNPLWALSAMQPLGEVYFLDSVMPRAEFAVTPVYNEWFRPAGFGLAMMGANLQAGDGAAALIAIANAPGKDEITARQERIFKRALPHIDRAVRIHRELRLRDLDHDAAPDELDAMSCGMMLVDGAARVLFANKRARALLGNRSGLTLQAGRLEGTNDRGVLQGLIASCALGSRTLGGPGGEIVVRQSTCRSLRVTVMPVRPRGSVAELPWLGLQLPAAMITISDLLAEKSPV